MRTFFTLKTEYSITRSTITVKNGVQLAKKNGYDTLALADDRNLFAGLDFANECVKAGIFPIIGVTCFIKYQADIHKITFFARTQEGYENLLFLTGDSVMKSIELRVIPFENLVSHFNGIIVLLDSPNLSLISDILSIIQRKEDLYIKISRFSNMEEEIARENALLELSVNLNLPIIAVNEAYFQSVEMFEAADILQCIGEGKLQLDDAREKLYKNNYFKSSVELTKLFADLPEAIENANQLKYKISYIPTNSRPLLPSFASDEKKVMTEMAKAGLEQRINEKEILGFSNGFMLEDYLERLDYEIKVISDMGFCGYFLMVADFIKWSKANEIPVGPGRGSGAGSLIAYSLNITDIDPLHYGLLFERFLNPERISMPDFDVDFCQEGRGRVINYVKEKYGSESVAGIITFGRLQARAVLKDVGRVMQIPYNITDKICKLIPFNAVDPISLEKAIQLDPELQRKREEDDMVSKLLDIGLKLEGLIRHSSTHAAGIIIADRPLIKIVPLFKSEGDELPAVGYHMKAAENAGLVKFDFLGLTTLTIISKTCEIIFQEKGIKLEISKIPINDDRTFEFLQQGLTLGIFQLESLVCRDAMKKMKIDKLEDIIALTSLNRPGPMENIPSYINRKLGREYISYPHSLLEELLRETYGIIIYQEQVIKIAQVLAGYTLGEADLLRRAMGKKLPEEMDAQRKIFIKGAIQNNVEESTASGIFDLVEKFAGYGFNKSHAAAYSVISYQCAFLKAHYPVEFLVANLNLNLSNTDEVNLLINDARQMGIYIHIPCINSSGTKFQAKGREIFYGLGALKSVGAASMEEMIEIRSNKPFTDIFDFCRRTGNKISNKKQLEALTKSGAFDCLGINRKQILTSIDILLAYATDSKKAENSQELSLFEDDENLSSPRLKEVCEDFTSQENLINEFESIGFYLSKHPLLNYKEKLELYGFSQFNQLEDQLAGEKEKRFNMAGVVSIVKQRSGSKGRFAFVYFSEVNGIFETSIFKDELITKHRENLVSGKLLALSVSANRQENGSIRIIINNIFPLEEYMETLSKKANKSNNSNKSNNDPIKARFAPAHIMPLIEEEVYKEKVLNIKFKILDLEKIRNLAVLLLPLKLDAGNTNIILTVADQKILLPAKYTLPLSMADELVS